MTGRYLTPAEQLAALDACISRQSEPQWPSSREDITAMREALGDPLAGPDPQCWACVGTGTTVASRSHAEYPESAAWPPGQTFGPVTCRACNGTGLRDGWTRCDDCEAPVLDDALCEACKALPRCRRCALRLGEDARPGSECDDCDRQARIDFEINLGEL